jgi:hypothetical protein
MQETLAVGSPMIDVQNYELDPFYFEPGTLHFEEYARFGGLLNQRCFGAAHLFDLGEINVPKNNSSRVRAEHMSSITHVPLTLKQIELYIVLREISPLGDEELLREVIRLTDEESLKFFMSFYLHLFSDSISQNQQ